MGKVIEWTKKELDYIVENYKDKSFHEIAKTIGRTKKAVSVKVSKMGLKKDPKYNFQTDFFQKIDNEEKAYWLGFIYADGYISFSKGRYVLGIEIKNSDINHLKKFNKSIKGNLEIKSRERVVGIYSTKCIMSNIKINSKTFVSNLVGQGVTEKKSKTMIFPKIDKKLINHFVRGYFDGDGSISIEKRSNQLRCNFTSGSPDFLNHLKIILDELNISSYISRYGNNSYQLGITGRNSTISFLNYIYDNSNIYLERKYKKYKANEGLLVYVRKGWDKTNKLLPQ